MSWKVFLVAWAAGTVGASFGRWLWGKLSHRPKRRETPHETKD